MIRYENNYRDDQTIFIIPLISSCLIRGIILFILLSLLISEPSLIFAAQKEDEIRNHLERGFILLQRGDLNNASKEFSEVISLDKDNPYAHHNLGIVYTKKGRLNDAETEFKKSMELKPDFVAPYFRLGVLYRIQGKIDDAISELKKSIEIDPTFQPALLQLGLIHESRGFPEFAVENYLSIININKETIQAKKAKKRMEQIGSTPDEAKKVKNLVNEANGYLKEGMFDNAVMVLTNLVDILPGMTFAHHNLGFIYGGTGRIQEAIIEFRKAIEGNPQYIPSHFLLGKLYESQKMLKEAVEEYNNVLLLAKTREIPEAKVAESKLFILGERAEMLGYFEKGEEFLRQKDISSALNEFKSAVLLSPDNYLAHYNLGLFYSRIGKLTFAVYEMEESIRIMPDFLPSYLAIGDIYERLHYFFRSIQYYLSVLSRDPKIKSKDAENAMKRIMSVAGKIQKAKEEVKPYIKEIKNMFADEDKDIFYEEILQKLQAAASIYPEEPLIHLYRGLIYTEQDKETTAINEFKTVLDLNPDYLNVHHYLGKIYEDRHNYSAAIDQYKSFIIKSRSMDVETEISEQEAASRLERLEKEFKEIRVRSNALFNKGVKFSKEGDTESAIDAFIEALSYEPENIFIHNSLGIAYFRNGNINEAVEEFKKVITLDPEHYEVHLRLGIIFEKEGFIKNAIREYNTTVQLADKSSVEAEQALERLKKIDIMIKNKKRALFHFKRAVSLGKLKQKEMTEKELNKAVSLDPANYLYHYNLGAFYHRNGNINKAVEEYIKTNNSNQRFFESRFRLGTIYDSKGQFSQAIKQYEAAMNLIKDKDKKETEQIKTRLKTLKKRLYTTLNYSTSYDNNINPSKIDKKFDLISNLSSDFTYYLFKGRNINLTSGNNIQITKFHNSQILINNNRTSLDLNHRIFSNIIYAVGSSLQWQIIERDGLISTNTAVMGEITKRGNLPTSTTLHFDYLDFSSKDNPQFDAKKYTWKLSVFQQFTPKDQINISYSFLQSDVEAEALSSESHIIALNFSRRILSDIKVNAGVNYSPRDKFVNPVPGTGGLYRINKSLLYFLGFSYSAEPDFTISVNYSHRINRSNLSDIFNALEEENLVDIVTEQTSSRGSYEKDIITAGVNLSF
ncbi:MAG: tetratricopeptide repeat protein [Nitrospirota bacterium]